MHSTRSAVQASLASASPGHPMTPSGIHTNGILAEGWVLKKRRKRMQGFARRYFTLHQSGLLSYSFEPGQPVRDQIYLNQAAISSTPGRKDIHVDSNNATFHIKCLSEDDFNKWMSAFRKFIVQDNATAGRRSSISRSMSRAAYNSRTGLLAEEMGQTLAELQSVAALLAEEDLKKKHGTAARLKAEKDRLKEHTKEHSGAVLGLFKSSKKHHTNHDSTADSPNSFESSHSPPLGTTLSRLQAAIDALRHQHSALTKSLTIAHHESPYLPSRGSPLTPTAEEGFTQSPAHSTYSTVGKSLHRKSVLSTTSDGNSSVWYDAPEFDGAEEFVLDATPADEGGSKMLALDAPGTPPEGEEGSDSELDEVHSASTPAKGHSDSTPKETQIVRRTQLPSPPVGDEGSLFAVLKKNVGKDLSQVALPVTFNEPLTLLQRCAEELEYYDLLTQAVQATDPIQRMCFVSAFAVSAYASSKHRSGRKGFNPMLAETFEDSRLKFIAEKVVHNPVVMAYHAEADGWELYATTSGKTKFWGKSLEIIPQGVTHLKVGDDHFQWTRPSSFMRNIMMGTKYLEHAGKMVVENSETGLRCVLEFKESGYWGPSNQVIGTVLSSTGETKTTLEGKWDEQLAQKLDSSHLRVLWRISPFPRNAPEYYGFTTFGITLNEITSDLKNHLPPTDSRLRPDVRALEEGDIDEAEEEKHRVEEAQRERRKKGEERKPRWFKQAGEEWIYTGGYWEQRANGWKDIEPLW